jgi:predicted secreted protein
MRWTSMLAIYALFWVLSGFLVLPFGLRTPEEAGQDIGRGHVASAPVNFRPGRVALRATVLSLALFALFYANFREGWVSAADLDWTRWLGASN